MRSKMLERHRLQTLSGGAGAIRRKAAESIHVLADSIDKLQLPPSPRKRLLFPRHDVGQTFDVFFNIV